jgi:hypothetical protein
MPKLGKWWVRDRTPATNDAAVKTSKKADSSSTPAKNDADVKPKKSDA